MPDILFKSVEDLPEELRPHSKPASDGQGVLINLVPNSRLQEFRQNNIDLVQERDTLKAFQDRVHGKFPDFDPDGMFGELEVLRGLSRRVSDGELTESTAIEDQINKRTGSMKASYEEQIRMSADALRKAQDGAKLVESMLKEERVRNKVSEVLHDPKVGVQASAASDIVARAQTVWGFDGEKMVPRSGGAVLYGADGINPMTMQEWVNSLKDRSPHLFINSTGGGGGGTGTAAEKTFAGFSRDEIARMGPEERIRLYNEANKPKGY